MNYEELVQAFQQLYKSFKEKHPYKEPSSYWPMADLIHLASEKDSDTLSKNLIELNATEYINLRKEVLTD